jgi:alkylation response protein AidB-like acyl-CoA dehydrogenase
MDFNLNQDQKAFVHLAAQFAQAELAPLAAHWDQAHIFPKEVIHKAGDLGFCGLYSPLEQGGLGLPRLDAVLIFEALAEGCTATTAMLTIHNMVAWMITSFASAEIKEVWSEPLTTGKKLGSYCLTEPGSGSDAVSLKTTAVADGSDYVVNGEKVFISGAGATEVLVVMCRTGASGSDGISALVIPADAEGITYGKPEKKLGWHAQPTCSVSFRDVRVAKSHLLAEEGQGFKLAMQGLDGGRLNIAACSLGTAQAALNQTKKYMHERQQFGRRLADFQALQFKYADMETELAAARQLLYWAAFQLDSNHPEKVSACAMAKRFVTDIGFQVCNEALQIHGGYGYIQDYPLERYLRDVRVHQILEGTNEIMRLIIARRLLEL